MKAIRRSLVYWLAVGILATGPLHGNYQMEHWGFWDWVAYSVLFAGALILAAETGLTQSPQLFTRLPKWIKHPYWGLAPLVLVITASCILGVRAAGVIGSREPERRDGLTDTPSPDPSKVFLQSWGLYPPATYQVTVNANQIANYKENNRLMLIVRSNFSDVDRMTDTHIEKSGVYTIESGIMVLAHASENRLRFLIQGATTLEYDVVMIPISSSEQDIVSLGSVEKIGGRILASAAQIATTQKQAEKSKFCSMLSC